MDFTKYELSDELRATLAKDYEADVSGLKNKNTELIDREKSIKSTNEELTLKLQTQEEDAKVALAEKDGTVEQYKAAVAERDEKINSIQFEFKETENKRVLESSVNEFSSVLTKDPAHRMYMQKLFQDSVGVVDGVVKPKDPTQSLEDLKQSLVTDKANAKYIAANVGSGTGSAGSQSGSSTAKSLKQMTATEEAIFANQNPVEYSQMINN